MLKLEFNSVCDIVEFVPFKIALGYTSYWFVFHSVIAVSTGSIS